MRFCEKMKKALVIFGSKTDEKIYSRICEVLKENNVAFELRISSAHKTPEDVDETLKKDYSVVIAGAGLAAHLPGVVAARIIRPVIGVPCEGNYQGLDALLAIAQMPPGIPVLAVGVGKADVAAENCIKMIKNYDEINVIGDGKNDAVRKCIAALEKLKAPFSFSNSVNENMINIQFTYFDEPIESNNELVIYCPLLLEKDDKAEAALNLLKHSSHGLWVGINNGTNAAIAAVEILNINDKYKKQLLDYRKEMGKKVLDANK